MATSESDHLMHIGILEDELAEKTARIAELEKELKRSEDWRAVVERRCDMNREQRDYLKDIIVEALRGR